MFIVYRELCVLSQSKAPVYCTTWAVAGARSRSGWRQ